MVFVSVYSYVYAEKMTEGLCQGNNTVTAIVSKNMKGIENWRSIKGLKLYEVDGYTSVSNFIPKLIKFYIKDSGRVKRICNGNRTKCLYVPFVSFWTYFIYRIVKNNPMVYTLHDPDVHNTGRSNNKVISYFNNYLAQRAQKIIILSSTYREYVCQKYCKKKRDIHIIPSGIESVDSKETNIIVNYDNEKYNFLFYGAISKHKGLNILGKAYSELSKKYNVSLTVAGNGDFAPYTALFDTLQNCTVINRWIEDSEVNGLFNDKNVVLVLPYLEATQSGVINVAMPLGTPIIATKCGGIVEQIEHGKTGFLVEPNSVKELYRMMEYVIQNWESLDSIRRNAYEEIKKRDWKILSSILGQIINDI